MLRSSDKKAEMKNRILLIALALAAGLLFIGWWLHEDPESRPLVCEQISPGVKHARQCTAKELTRVRSAYRWVVDNAPHISPAPMAGVVSFVVDTGKRKRSIFFARLSRGDIDGACEQMLAYVNRHGEPDQVRIARRQHERALCLTKG